MLFLFDKLYGLPLVTLEQLAELSTRLSSDMEVVLHEIMQDKKNRIEPEGNFEIFRDIAIKLQEQTSEVDSPHQSIQFEHAQKEFEQKMA
ncbi:hypothetical protein R0K20_17730, partial [Staphylococcus sp. SIMBA_130]